MQTSLKRHWRTAHIGPKGDRFKLDGQPVWQREWRWVDRNTVRLPDPLNGNQVYSFMICEIGPNHSPVRFAAAEIGPSMWAFYVED